MEREVGRGSRGVSFVFGALLIIGGIALLAAQLYGYDLRVDLGRLGWPAFVILPGLALLVAGLMLGEEPGVGLSIAGGIVTTVGLILTYQQATNHFASWAYAWALVAPTAVGVAMMLWGALHLRGGVFRSGLASAGVGLVLFLVFFGFFEGVLNIGDERGVAAYGRQALPFALILAGGLIVLSRLWPGRRTRMHGRWRPAGEWQAGDWRGGAWQTPPPAEQTVTQPGTQPEQAPLTEPNPPQAAETKEERPG
jgi:hypothetical protein